jgi:hypothetical protein
MIIGMVVAFLLSSVGAVMAGKGLSGELHMVGRDQRICHGHRQG